MGFNPRRLFNAGQTRQRLPIYEQISSPISNKERFSDDDLSSDDDDGDSIYAPSTASPGSTRGSRNSSGSVSTGTMMLPKRVSAAASTLASIPRRRRATNNVYRLPNRIVRCLCIAILMTLLLFITVLVRASIHENSRIAAGIINKGPAPPPPWESFDFLTRYYGGVRSLVSFKDNVPQYPREEDEQAFNTTLDSEGADNAPRVHLHAAATFAVNEVKNPVPPSTPFNNYQSSVFVDKEAGAAYSDIVPCFINKDNTGSVPPLRYLDGRPNGFPQNIMGSYELLDLPEDICFDRFGRYGPYGFGYSVRTGGLGVGEYGEKEGSEAVWETNNPIDYTNVDWAEIQQRCFTANARRFKPTTSRYAPINGFYIGDSATETPAVHHAPRDVPAQPDQPAATKPVPSTAEAAEAVGHDVAAPAPEKAAAPATPAASAPKNTPVKQAPPPPPPAPQGDAPRTAVVVRCWDEFKWQEEDIMNFRALISELSLASGGRYDVHLLVQVKDDAKYPIWADDETYKSRIEETIPAEFRGLVTLWTETQMLSLYQGIHDLYTRGPGLPVHGVYRGLQMAMQHFAHNHPEYAYFWQWEMDIRYTGHNLDLFTKMENWARKQPRKGLWERNARFYMPSVHGSWDDFRQMARVQTEVGLTGADNIWNGVGGKKKGDKKQGNGARVGENTVWGPERPADPNDWFEPENDPVPPTTYEKDRYTWGVDEEADLITLNPIFDPEGTTWLLADDITGYNASAETDIHGHSSGKPPRRAQIITASRMSRRMLLTMHRETALKKHHAFSEMWPATAALQHGFKAVYVPHPVYVDREWPTQYMSRTFNGGRNGATGGSRTSIFGQREHNFLGTTWYYNSGFSGNLYRRWLGLKVNNDGGAGFEEQADTSKDDSNVSNMRGGEGRMCLPPMLLHPIKNVDLPVESNIGDEYAAPPTGDPSA